MTGAHICDDAPATAIGRHPMLPPLPAPVYGSQLSEADTSDPASLRLRVVGCTRRSLARSEMHFPSAPACIAVKRRKR
jgi:hypothetical protein